MITSMDGSGSACNNTTLTRATPLQNGWLSSQSRNVEIWSRKSETPIPPQQAKRARWHRFIRNWNTFSQDAESNIGSEQEKIRRPLTTRFSMHSEHGLSMLARGIISLPVGRQSVSSKTACRLIQESSKRKASRLQATMEKPSATSHFQKNDIGPPPTENLD